MSVTRWPHRNAKAIILILATLLCTADGRSPTPNTHDTTPAIPSLAEHTAQQKVFERTNPCGLLRIRNPLFNVTGFLTAEARINSTVTLFIAPNTTLSGALYAAEHCPALLHVPLTEAGTFVLSSLTEGIYVLSLPRDTFVRGQGFPIIHELNTSTHTIEQVWQGGNQRHSLVMITIRPTNTTHSILETP